MGRISKNGFINGSIANLVFVNQGDRNIVRSKPDHVKQSANTKKAAGIFGYVSRQDALYRRRLMFLFALTTDDRYAYRHRALMCKMAVRHRENSENPVSLLEGNPRMMEHFNFNRHLEWQSVCRFFPDIHLDDSAGVLTISVPELGWNRELKPPPKMTSAKLRFICITALPDEAIHQNVQLLSEFQMDAAPGQRIQETVFSVNGIPEGQLIFVIAEIQLQDGKVSLISPQLRTAGIYLWGGKR